MIVGVVAGPVLAGSGAGRLHPEVEVARFLHRAGGLFELGLAGAALPARAAAFEFLALSGRFRVAALASGGTLGRIPVAVLAGFVLDPVLPLALATGFAAEFVVAIHRVRRA